MCFSAEASFIGGAVLTAIGIATITRNKQPSQRLFATIPFVFGIQQISEGFVWTASKTPGNQLMLDLAIYFFLFAALVIWPAMVPISVLLTEKPGTRKRVVLAFTVVGCAVALYNLGGMILTDVTAQIIGFHIVYTIGTPKEMEIVTTIAYLIATLLPMFFASTKKMPIFGIIVVISYIIAFIFYRESLASVWCFFAALCSAVIYWIVTAPASQKVTNGRLTANG